MVKGNPLQVKRKGSSVFLQPSGIVGDVFYVDNTNGSNSNNGRDWQRAFSTLNYAISKCSDNAGDLIILAPYHAETIQDTGSVSGTATDEVVIDKVGITIKGLGYGMLRPTFTLSGETDAAFVVTAATTDIVIDNLILTSNRVDVAAGITLTATSDGATIQNCEFKDGGSNLELVIGITIAAACNDVSILNCNFLAGTNDDASAVELAGACDRMRFIGNVCQGTYSNAAFDGDQAASKEMVITHNVIANLGSLACGLHANCTGILAWNIIAGNSGTVATGLVNSLEMWQAENYVTDVVNASGIIYPNADSDT